MRLMVISAISKPGTTTHTLARLAAEACEGPDVTVDFVTPGDLNLPVNDGQWAWNRPELEAWRTRILETDAHIWVSPEYHGALAASLKNLFDYLDKSSMDGSVVGLCALAGGAVAALNTLNGMTTIARSLGAWVVPNVCAFSSPEVKEGLSDRALARLQAMCTTVIDMSHRLAGPMPGTPEEGLAVTVATLERAEVEAEAEAVAEQEPAPPIEASAEVAVEATVTVDVPGVQDFVEAERGISGTRYTGTREGKPVVVRVVPAALLEGDERARFEREQAQVRSLPPHPNVMPVLDVGVNAAGEGYVVSEGGTSLIAQLRMSGPYVWRDAVDATVRLAGALETIHRAGLLHRDLGPMNVLIDSEGRPAITDIAAAPEGVRALERQRQGALAHLAPELFRGDPNTPASDVYALGSALFSMVVGRPAFTDDADKKIVALIRRIAIEPVPDLRGQLPDPVCAVIERAMAKAPDARFATAEEMARSLQQAQMLTEMPTSTVTLFVPSSAAGAAPPPSPAVEVAAAAAQPDAVSVFSAPNPVDTGQEAADASTGGS